MPVSHSFEYAQGVHVRVFASMLTKAFMGASVWVLGRIVTRVLTRAATTVLARVIAGVLWKALKIVFISVFFITAYAHEWSKSLDWCIHKSIQKSWQEYSQEYSQEFSITTLVTGVCRRVSAVAFWMVFTGVIDGVHKHLGNRTHIRIAIASTNPGNRKTHMPAHKLAATRWNPKPGHRRSLLLGVPSELWPPGSALKTRAPPVQFVFAKPDRVGPKLD